MKKNKIMRVASVLLILTLLRTCALSSTFAKYTTAATASDSARVAKWGVTAQVTGGAFSKTYKDPKDTEITVSSSTEENLLAPGTSGTFGGVEVSGIPEVDVNIDINATVELDGWEIEKSSEDDSSPGSGFIPEPSLYSTIYCPLEFNINGTTITMKGTDENIIIPVASELEKLLEEAIEKASGTYKAGTDLSTIPGLNGDYTWTWAFEGNDDEKDTILGQMDVPPTVKITVEVIITQVD